jgi:hypothetical protein
MIQSQKSFAFVEEARNAMSDLKDTQERASVTLKGSKLQSPCFEHAQIIFVSFPLHSAIEPLLNENGGYSTARETKTIINELQAENYRCKATLTSASQPFLNTLLSRSASERSPSRKAPHNRRRACGGEKQDTGT